MATPNDTELLGPSGAVTRLPSLGSPELSTEYLARIKEILEALLGRRGGNDWDKVVTFRDLHGMGWQGGAGGGGMVFNMAGAEIDPGAPGFQQFVGRLSDEIMRSAAFKSLKSRIGSAESNEHLPAEIRRQLSLGLQQVARERQAAIHMVEEKVQSNALSMASQLKEITAALERTAAGVRQFDVAYADRTQAIALKVTQLAASLEGVGAVELEERFQAIASEIDGLQGQWSMKIQAIGASGIPVIAGIALAVESPIAGAGTSSLIFMAEKFGFVTQNGTTTPFVIVGDQIEFNGNVRINGQLVIGADGLQPGFEAPDTKNSDFTNGKLMIGGDNLAANSSFEKHASELATGYFVYNNDFTNEPTGVQMAAGRTGGLSQVIYWANSHIQAKGIQGQVCPSGWAPGKTYIISVYARTTFTPSPGALYLGWDTAPASTVALSNPPLTTGFQRYSFRITWGTQVQATGWAYISVATGASGAGNVLFDDLMVVEGDVLPGYVPSVAETRAFASAALDALPGITADIATKLSKTGNEEIYGQKSLMSQYAILVGTVNDGIIHGSTGLYGRKAGFTTFSLGADGTAIYAGALMAAYGTFGAVSIAAGGHVRMGMTAYAVGSGFYLGDDGGVPKFSVGNATHYIRWSPAGGLEIKFPQITLAALSNVDSPSGANGTRIYTTRTLSVTSGGTAPFTYRWSYAYANGLSLYDATSATCTVVGTATNDGTDGLLVGEVTDANGLTAKVSCNVSGIHGTPP